MEIFNQAFNVINESLGLTKLKKILSTPLAKKLFNINQQDKLQANTLLHYAAAQGDVDVIDYLINNKAALLLRNKEGLHPLQLAIKSENFFAARTLLIHIKAAINNSLLQQALINEALLILFVEYAKTEINAVKYTKDISLLKLLINYGADVNLFCQSSDKSRLIHMAARFDNSDAVITHILLEAGAEVEVCDAIGDTALHIAAKNLSYSHVAILLPKAHINLQNNEGDTSLHCLINALKEQNEFSVKEAILGQFYIKLLIDAGASLTLTNKTNQTVLKLYQEYETTLLKSGNKLILLVNYFKQLFYQKAHIELVLDYKQNFSINPENLPAKADEAKEFNFQTLCAQLEKTALIAKKKIALKQNRYQFFQIDALKVESLIKQANENVNLASVYNQFLGLPKTKL